MNLAELNDLDFENIGSWPSSARVIAVVFLFLIGMGSGFYFYLEDELAVLHKEEGKERGLKQRYQFKYKQTAVVPAMRKQLEEGEGMFDTMLQQLPRSVDVASLLADISSAGLAEGLSFESITPQDEEHKDFYAELPIEIKLQGEYHQFGRFVSRLSALPRIVTLHDIHITPDTETGVTLHMQAIAKTYWYVQKDEE